MKRYFDNYELKRSSIVLVLLIASFLLITSIGLKVQNDNLKESYIKSLGAISVRLLEKNHELEKQIIPLITKEITKAEGIKGKSLLAKYGLTKNLEDNLFPYIKTTARNRRNAVISMFILMAVGILYFLWNEP